MISLNTHLACCNNDHLVILTSTNMRLPRRVTHQIHLNSEHTKLSVERVYEEGLRKTRHHKNMRIMEKAPFC